MPRPHRRPIRARGGVGCSVAETVGTQSFADRHPLLRGLPAIVASTLGALAVIAYPLGLIAYWIQIWRDYTHDATVALYAASLVPVSVAAGRALELLFVAFMVANFALFGISLTHTLKVAKYSGRERTGLRRWMLTTRGRIVTTLIDFGLAAFLPLGIGLISLDRVGDVPFYLCAVAVAGGGGHLVSSLTAGNLKEVEETRRTVGIEGHEEEIARDFLSAWLRAGVALAVTAVVACLFLIPLQSPPLAEVTFDGTGGTGAKLISHSEGYWYVIESGDRNVTAIPDSTASTAKISRP